MKKQFTTPSTDDTTNATDIKLLQTKCVELIDDGLAQFENLLTSLQTKFKFNLDDFLDNNAGASMKGLKFIGLALVSAQKIFLFLGDLCRYKEQLNNSKNFGRSKQWYVKAQQLIPSNGMPYNQLAIISLYTVGYFFIAFKLLKITKQFNLICRKENSMLSIIICEV